MEYISVTMENQSQKQKTGSPNLIGSFETKIHQELSVIKIPDMEMDKSLQRKKLRVVERHMNSVRAISNELYGFKVEVQDSKLTISRMVTTLQHGVRSLRTILNSMKI